MANELLTFPGSSPTAVSDYQHQNAILAALMAGFMRLSLTEWATATIPQIAAGSIVEVGGSMYQFAADTSISGSPADGTVYVYMICSGSNCVPTWSSVAPTWSDAKNGWYSGNNRAVAKMTKSGASYTLKEMLAQSGGVWVYTSMLHNLQVTEAKLGAAAVAQSKLKTSIGSANASIVDPIWMFSLVLPGGEYGFYPQVLFSNAHSSLTGSVYISECLAAYTSYATRIYMRGNITAGQTGKAYAQQRYVTSSGEVFWIFIKRDKATKKILSMWQAPDHPCMGNGGKPLLVPHPFQDYDPGTQEIVVVNPDLQEVEYMRSRCMVPGETEPARDLLDVILSEYEIEEKSRPIWPEQKVTVGLPPGHNWQAEKEGTIITPIKKAIPRAEMLIARAISRRR